MELTMHSVIMSWEMVMQFSMQMEKMDILSVIIRLP